MQSNATRQVAAACVKIDIECHLGIMRGRLANTEPGYEDTGNAGKSMTGLIGLPRRGRFHGGRPVVWIHTGGGPGIFAYPTTKARLLG